MVLPVLSIMLVAIIYGGITFFNYVELSNAVAVGARTLGTTGRLQGTNACATANTALTTAAGNLNASQITIGTEAFASGNTCTTAPVQGDAAVVSAVYPCNLPIPFTNINLCPLANGGQITAAFSGAPALVSCPYSHCISAATYVYIE